MGMFDGPYDTILDAGGDDEADHYEHLCHLLAWLHAWVQYRATTDQHRDEAGMHAAAVEHTLRDLCAKYGLDVVGSWSGYAVGEHEV